VEVREFRGNQQQTEYTLRFRIDRYDASGNRLGPVGVEMHRYRGGQLTDGDEVEVTGSPKDGTLIAKDIVNLTTGSKALGGIRIGTVIFMTVVLLLFGAWFIFIALKASGIL